MERDETRPDSGQVTAPGKASPMSPWRRVIILCILAAIALAAYFAGPTLYRAFQSKPPSSAGAIGRNPS